MSPRFRTLAATTALVSSLAGCSSESAPLDTMRVTDVVRDILAEEPAWETVQAHPELAPKVDVVSPSYHFSMDGAGIPALVVAPPGEVQLTVPEDAGTCVFRGRCGVDISTLRFLSAEHPSFTFEFEVLLDGEAAFATSIVVAQPEGGAPGTSWVDIGGEDGLAVRPGVVVSLKTWMRDAKGERLDPPTAIFVGFGGLRLERSFDVARTRSSPVTPNVVVLLMDTLRTDRLSTYGYDRPTSPNLDRLAERGLLFDEAYATSSWTWPSTASVFTGLHPQEHGILDKGSCYLASELTTLSEVFQRAGFTTAAWSGNPLISPPRNFDQGFESFDYPPDDFRKSAEFFDDVVGWIEDRGEERFYLYLHLAEPHAPYDALPEDRALLAPEVPADYDTLRYGDHSSSFLKGEGHGPNGVLRTDDVVSLEERAWYSDLYDACVRSGDRYLGVLLDTLEAQGLDDRTIVVFTNDHGEELFDRGMMNHGQSVFGELVRAPLVLAGPGIPPGTRSSMPVSNRQLAPTLARLAGVDFSGVTDPVDLVRPEPGDRTKAVLFSTHNGWWKGKRGTTIYGLRLGERVLHFAPEGAPWGAAEPSERGDTRLFDVGSDPVELDDLAPASPSQAEMLSESIRSRVEELEKRRPKGSLAAGEATLQLLRRIGYLGEDE